MSIIRPDFMTSPYFVPEPGNWHLKPGAPEDVVKEFELFTKHQKAEQDDVARIPKLKE